MNLIDQTLNQSKEFSPRKQRERELEDKILVFCQENSELLYVIKELENLNMELQHKNMTN